MVEKVKSEIGNERSKDIIHISRREFLKLAMATPFLLNPRFTKILSKVSELAEKSPEDTKIEFLRDKTKETEGIFSPKNPINLYVFPLRNDLTFDPQKQISIFEMPSGVNMSYHNFYFFRGAEGKIHRLTILPNTMGSHNLVVAKLDSGKFEMNGNYSPNEEEDPGLNHSLDHILGDFSYIVGHGQIYPNKILNLLNSMALILEEQERSGPFKRGQTYSYIDLIRLAGDSNYLPGYTSSHNVVTAGGVCAGATALASAFWVAAQNLGIKYENTYRPPRMNHPERYKMGPFAPSAFITDTTVEISEKGRFDYCFIPPTDLYIDIHAAVIPNGISFSETDPQGLCAKEGVSDTIWSSDVQLVLNISLTTKPPTTRSNEIRSIWQQYMEFRRSKHKTPTNIIASGCSFSGIYSFESSPDKEIGMQIYPEENTHIFETEIRNSQYLQDVFSLKEILNKADDSTLDIAGLVRSSKWYKEKVEKGQMTKRLESGINQLSYTHIKGQPVQCVAWAILLSTLPHPCVPRELGVPMKGPRDLIPNSILTRPERQIALSPTGGLLIAERDMCIDYLNAGDLFLMRKPPPGHVGIILDKKVFNGKTYLLVTEANRHNDGKIYIYTVDKYNFDAKLGTPPEKKIILR